MYLEPLINKHLNTCSINGEGEIRTRGTSVHRYDGLANASSNVYKVLWLNNLNYAKTEIVACRLRNLFLSKYGLICSITTLFFISQSEKLDKWFMFCKLGAKFWI